MSDSHPPAAPAPKGGGSARAWSMTALLTLVVLFNVIGMLSGQLNSLFRVFSANAGVLMVLGAAYFLRQGKK